MISVCIATFNGEKYIKEQVASILAQIRNEDEIIVSDDGSQDKTIEEICSFNDSRIKIFHNHNHGLVSNFENAINNTSGDIIFLSDQDDVWAPNKVERCMSLMGCYDLLVHNAIIIYEKERNEQRDFFTIHNSKSGYWNNMIRNSFMGCCMVFRKEVKEYILPFPHHILWHDMWIGLMVEKYGKTIFIDDKLLYYRRHNDNVSPTSEKSSFSKWIQIKYRLQMLWYTLLR